MDVGNQKVKVTKASFGSTQVANFDVGITAISGLASQMSGETDKGRVIQLLNMVTAEELMDNEEYEGLSPSPGPLFGLPAEKRAQLRILVQASSTKSDESLQKFATMCGTNAPSSARFSS